MITAPHKITPSLASASLVLGKPHNAAQSCSVFFWSREKRVSQSTQGMSHKAELSPGLMEEEGQAPSLPPLKVSHPLITWGKGYFLRPKLAWVVCVSLKATL